MGFNRYIIVKKRILGITCNTPTTLLVNDMLGGWGKGQRKILNSGCIMIKRKWK